MLYKPAVISYDPELGEKIKLLPERDFFIRPNAVENLDLMLLANRNNKKAFEYKMAWLLLNKDFKGVVYQVKRMKDMKYTRLPLHIEEAVLLFINYKYELPYLGDFKIRKETEEHFNQFLTDYQLCKKGNSTESEKLMKTSWGNTFWYYFEFK
jgi:hypothetical protein